MIKIIIFQSIRYIWLVICYTISPSQFSVVFIWIPYQLIKALVKQVSRTRWSINNCVSFSKKKKECYCHLHTSFHKKDQKQKKIPNLFIYLILNKLKMMLILISDNKCPFFLWRLHIAYISSNATQTRLLPWLAMFPSLINS